MQVAIYIRVSTDDQAEQGISIPAQKSRLIAFCQAQGWDIYDFYIDDGYSGKDLDRPEIQRLINDAQEKKFESVCVLKLDRLSRRQKDILYLLEDVFDANGIGFKSVTESFDTSTPFGKAALGMMAVFAQLERETIIERVRMAKKESARQGRFMGGPAPYGYAYDPATKRLIVSEAQAETVRWVFDEYLRGIHGYDAIADMLNSQGISSPSGGTWNKQAIRKILSSPFYIGYIPHKGSMYVGNHEAIISREKWDAVQSLLCYASSHRRAAEVNKGLVSGLIYCGECGARMRYKAVWQQYPRVPKKVMRYYVCYSQEGSQPHMIKKPGCRCGYKHVEEIDARVVEKLQEISFSKDYLEEIAREALNADDKKNLIRQINRGQKELATVRAKLDRWYEAFEKGAIDPAELIDRIKDLREKKNTLEAQITEWEDALRESDSRAVTVAEVVELLQNFPAIWEEASPEEKKAIVRNLVSAVYVYQDDRIEIKIDI